MDDNSLSMNSQLVFLTAIRTTDENHVELGMLDLVGHARPRFGL